LAAQRKSGKYFFSRAENVWKFFPGKSVHALTRSPESFPTTQKTIKNLSKTHFSDVIAISAYQGHLQPDSFGNPAMPNAKK